MTREERAQVWQRHITAWQASGLSGLSYCKAHSLTYSRFVYWRRKLDAAQTAADECSASGFARVTSVSDAPGLLGLTVSLPGGVTITGLDAGNIRGKGVGVNGPKAHLRKLALRAGI